MSFTYTRNTADVFGSKRVVSGTYTNSGGSTGGDIVTGLTRIESFESTNNTQAATVNKVLTSGGTVTITTVADDDGLWQASGV